MGLVPNTVEIEAATALLYWIACASGNPVNTGAMRLPDRPLEPFPAEAGTDDDSPWLLESFHL
jgi:hypothetical protein